MLRVKLFDNVGDIRGMHVMQALVAHGQLDLRHVALDELHVVPRDETLLERMAKRGRDCVHHLLEMWRYPKEQAADARFGTEQAQSGGTIGKLEVVYAHDLHALGVDNLLVEQVTGKQYLGRLQIGKANVG